MHNHWQTGLLHQRPERIQFDTSQGLAGGSGNWRQHHRASSSSQHAFGFGQGKFQVCEWDDTGPTQPDGIFGTELADPVVIRPRIGIAKINLGDVIKAQSHCGKQHADSNALFVHQLNTPHWVIDSAINFGVEINV
ncbi:unannotated protein [freshwater metagenome]|uniref:Unannotated protein n=1 Tax=freshwater metagenome TaxID=449393 RepID=A0A6J7LZU2_9ZZZZ